jgi:hypothetical protein
VAIDLAITLLMLTVSVASISFVKLGLGQRSPCLLLPMAWMHGVVLLLSVMTAWYAGMEAVEGFRQGGSREPEV